MHPRERVLERARLCVMRGRVFPVDLLAEAEAHGLDLSAFGQPKPQHTDHDPMDHDKERKDGFKSSLPD